MATSAPVCRVGDLGSHGGSYIGSITSGAATVTDEDKNVATIGSSYYCPTHGSNFIVTGSNEVYIEGIGVVRVGDTAECGAILYTGDDNFTIP